MAKKNKLLKKNPFFEEVSDTDLEDAFRSLAENSPNQISMDDLPPTHEEPEPPATDIDPNR